MTRSKTPDASVTDTIIRSRAYEIYCERISSGEAGDALSDWLEAKRQVSIPRRHRS